MPVDESLDAFDSWSSDAFLMMSATSFSLKRRLADGSVIR
jgi:hypothetical protein